MGKPTDTLENHPTQSLAEGAELKTALITFQASLASLGQCVAIARDYGAERLAERLEANAENLRWVAEVFALLSLSRTQETPHE